MKQFVFGESDFNYLNLVSTVQSKKSYQLSTEHLNRLRTQRKVVMDIAHGSQSVYGINTGFGYLSDVQISEQDIERLQVNFLRSHACGVGDSIHTDIVKGMMLTKIHQFLLGHSGVSEQMLNQLVLFCEKNWIPDVPKQGSVGASGDLAPLAHIGLTLMGEGYLWVEGKKVPSGVFLKDQGVAPHIFRAKEGLSMANGTHYMAVAAAFLLARCEKLLKAADVIACISLDAFRGSIAAFDARIHEARKQKGQIKVAQNVRNLFASGRDEINESHKNCEKIQDPYSFRCFPQVHGASRDAFEFCVDLVNRELNSSTDNPLMFEGNEFISGGNFHGQPIAMALDFLAIAMAEIGSISERRLEKLTIPHLSGLPAFLVKQNEGLNSGFMIAHYTASALVSANKLHAHPASVDSIPTSANKEDHVSMGPVAIHKLEHLVKNLENILAIEALAACQGLDLLAPLKPAPEIEAVFNKVRTFSDCMEDDRSLSEEIQSLAGWLAGGGIERTVSVKLL